MLSRGMSGTATPAANQIDEADEAIGLTERSPDPSRNPMVMFVPAEPSRSLVAPQPGGVITRPIFVVRELPRFRTSRE